MKITIKGVISGGLKECTGDLIELYGLQFCFTKVDKVFYFIELSSGGSVDILLPGMYYKKDALIRFKDLLSRKSTSEIQDAIKKFSKASKVLYDIEYPINEPIKL